MKIIGLTGGIGSGKTTIANMFKKLDVPVYNSDVEAKKLTNSSNLIKNQLINILGEEAYLEGELNKKYVAKLIFNDKELLNKVNAIIHPEVAKHFKLWCTRQKSSYVIKESAILFENKSYKNFDCTILITAPKNIRLDRVLKRDPISEKEVLERMKNQFSDDKKKELADFIIENIDLKIIEEKVKKIHQILLKL